MNNNKVECMKIARQFSYDFWDGDRKFGYGGHKYIDGYWEDVAKSFIKDYNLNNKSKILDVGCGKGFLLYEITKILPNIEIYGFDISEYAIKNSKEEISNKLFVLNNSKNDNKIGYFKTELINPISPMYFNDKERTSALISLCSLFNSLLPESQPNKRIYQSFEEFIKILNLDNWIILYIFFEALSYIC